MFNGGSASFAVVYSDGEREINMGTVEVEPTLNFKKLLSLLSHKIGISQHQFSVYLAAMGSDHKIPVTAKVDLTAMPRDGAAYFFVKRSRRYRKSYPANAKKKNPPQNVMLLRRNIQEITLSPPFPAATPILDRVEYEARVRNLWMERERFLMNMRVDDVSIGREALLDDEDERRASVAGGGRGGVVCEECLRAKLTGIDGGFHLCVNDEVTVGFRSPAGPICRPTKKSDEKCR